MIFEKKLVLDTCALLWLVQGNSILSEEHLNAIENAQIVFVSAISCWEISLKSEQKKLVLPMEPEKWFRTALEKHSIILAPLDISVLCAANKLPPHHKDPADRFIIATAMHENAAVITADTKFLKYDIKVVKI
jgi:PIN domain nuclease of toxin-antitoxin system